MTVDATPERAADSTLRARFRRALPQVIRFGVIGLFGFLVDVGGFNLLRYAGSGGEGPLFHYALSAKLISSTLGVIVSWLGNRYWVFKHTRRDELHHEFALFAVVSVIGIGIGLLCLWVSHYRLGFTSQLDDNIAANLVGLGLATVFRFWAYKRLVFISGRR